MKSHNFTSSLPLDLLDALDLYARKFKVPKNHIIEQALKAYFEKLKKAEYIHSFKKAAGDVEMISLAEEGLADYLKILEDK
jgi:metal-responsive CopG/Arc/MetJ family transcriptional regulator